MKVGRRMRANSAHACMGLGELTCASTSSCGRPDDNVATTQATAKAEAHKVRRRDPAACQRLVLATAVARTSTVILAFLNSVSPTTPRHLFAFKKNDFRHRTTNHGKGWLLKMFARKTSLQVNWLFLKEILTMEYLYSSFVLSVF